MNGNNSLTDQLLLVLAHKQTEWLTAVFPEMIYYPGNDLLSRKWFIIPDMIYYPGYDLWSTINMSNTNNNETEEKNSWGFWFCSGGAVT